MTPLSPVPVRPVSPTAPEAVRPAVPGEGSGGRWPGLRAWADAVLALVYPNVCELCGAERAGRAEGYVGALCRGRPGALRRIRAPFCDRCGLPFAGDVGGAFVCANCADLDLQFDSARAAVVATAFLLDVVHRYKYGGGTWFEPFLAGLLVEAAAPELGRESWDWLVPVPLHPLRERERGFNQSDRLARQLARATGIPVGSGLVRRVGATETQALLDRRDRAKNVARAFAVPRPSALAGCRVVVVDDVLTTGSTTSAVAAVLRQAGARAVTVWTVARGV